MSCRLLACVAQLQTKLPDLAQLVFLRLKRPLEGDVLGVQLHLCAGGRLGVLQRLAALTGLRFPQLVAQTFYDLVGAAARLAFLLDLQQRASFGGGRPFLSSLNVATSLGKVSAKSLLLALLHGATLLQLAQQFINARLGAGVAAALRFKMALDFCRGGLGAGDLSPQRFCSGFPLGVISVSVQELGLRA